jgi:hypothetical protein
MKVTEVSVEVGRTASVNFQSARNSIGLTAALEEGDQPDAVIRTLQKQAVDMLLGDREQFLDDELGNVASVDEESLKAAIQESAQSREY